MLSVDGQRMVSCSSYNVADGQGMVSCSSYSVADGFSRSGGTHVVYVAVFSTGWAILQVIYADISEPMRIFCSTWTMDVWSTWCIFVGPEIEI